MSEVCGVLPLFDSENGGPRLAPVQLRDYQAEAVEAALGAVERGVRRPLLSMATGLGKTVCFAEILRRRGGRGLVLVHRDELVRQAVAKIRLSWPDVSVGVVKGARDEYDAHVVVASVQSLHAKRLRRFAAGSFPTVVVDEAHHAVAPSYQAILDYLAPEMCLGVTATPYRGDLISLDAVFDEIVSAHGVIEGIRGGWLVDIESYRVTSGSVDLDAVHTQAGDFRQKELAGAVNTADRNDAVVDAYHRLAPGKRCVVFAAGVEHAHALAKAFEASGVHSAAVDASTLDTDRRAVLDGLASGSIPVVTNCGVLTEGFDCPAVEAVVLARPTKSLGLFTQMVGRGVRPFPGKSRLVLIDVVDATTKHKVITVAEMVGLRKAPANGASISAAMTGEWQARRSGAVEMLTGAGFTIERVDDVVAGIEAAGPMPRFDWKEVRQELDDLEASVANGTTRPERWWGDPISEGQAKALGDYGLPNVEVRNLTKGEASWIINSCDRRLGVWLKRREDVWALVLGKPADEVAAVLAHDLWQRRPATVKQLNYLKKLGVKVGEDGVSQGEASQLIDRAMSKSAHSGR